MQTTPISDETMVIHAPDYIMKAKKDGLSRFVQLGFPTKGEENWKYIPLSRYLPADPNPLDFSSFPTLLDKATTGDRSQSGSGDQKQSSSGDQKQSGSGDQKQSSSGDQKQSSSPAFTNSGDAESSRLENYLPLVSLGSLDSFIPFDSIDCYKIFIINGLYNPDLSFPHSIPGVEFLSFREAYPLTSFRQHFNTLTQESTNGLDHLNTAEFESGLYLRIGEGVKVSKPIHLVRVYTGAHDRIVQPRTLIVVEKHAELFLLETHSNGLVNGAQEADLFTNQVTEIILAPGAQVEHLRYHQMGEKVRAILSDQIYLPTGSQYRSHSFSLSGQLIRNTLRVDLAQPGAEAHLFGFYSIGGDQLTDNHTLVRHLAPHCQSNELYKGVLFGKSIGVFNGRVEVKPDAQKTNAYQQNQTILLSKLATMNSKPELEIFADDVKCSHGSTLGQLDSAAMFYLRSRGITELEAQRMLVKAFATHLLSQISHRDIMAQLEIYLEASFTDRT